MPFVDHRWLGGMLTNFKTVKASIKRLKDLEQMATDGTFERMTKREALSLQARARQARQEPGRHQGHERAARRDVRRSTSATTRSRSPRRRSSASRSSRVVDTNHSPDGIAHVIPGNDDSSRAIRLYARGVADAVLEGKSTVIQEIVQAGDEFVEVADDATA